MTIEEAIKQNKKFRNEYERVAVNLGFTDICIILCDFGANLDSFDNAKETPLHIAIRHKNTSLCKLLISRGANVNLLDANFKSYLRES
jgi:ankyrin repeat protein